MLRIDLLPRHFAIARKNKALLALLVVLLILAGAGWMFQAKSLSAQIEKVAEEDEALQPTLTQVDKYTGDAEAKQAELAPIKTKVDFADEADKSGRGYWKAFHDINEYISRDAQMTRFSVSGNSVSFEVRLEGTVAAGKFIINLLRCPVISGISVSGLPGGGGAGGGMPGGPGAPLGPPAGMPGVPGPPPGGLAGMPGGPPGGPRGMAGAPPGAPGGPGPALGGAPGSPDEILTLTISAALNPAWQIKVPAPQGAAVPAAAGPGGFPGAPPGIAGAPGPPGAPAGGTKGGDADDEDTDDAKP